MYLFQLLIFPQITLDYYYYIKAISIALTAKNTAHALGQEPRRSLNKQAVRVATQYAPPLSSPRRVPPSRRNVAVFSHRWPLQPPYALRPCWVKQPGDLDLRSFDLESGVRVTCDVGYFCASFGLPRPLCSRLRPDVRNRQMSDSHHRFMAPPAP